MAAKHLVWSTEKAAVFNIRMRSCHSDLTSCNLPPFCLSLFSSSVSFSLFPSLFIISPNSMALILVLYFCSTYILMNTDLHTLSSFVALFPQISLASTSECNTTSCGPFVWRVHTPETHMLHGRLEEEEKWETKIRMESSSDRWVVSSCEVKWVHVEKKRLSLFQPLYPFLLDCKVYHIWPKLNKQYDISNKGKHWFGDGYFLPQNLNKEGIELALP